MNLNFLQFLQDEAGDFSSMRLIVILWAIGILLMWCFCSFVQKCLQPLPESVVGIMMILITGKAVQKKIEAPKKDCKNDGTETVSIQNNG